MSEELNKDINTQSEDFKAGYRQGYIDGITAACEEIKQKWDEQLRKRNLDKMMNDDHK